MSEYRIVEKNSFYIQKKSKLFNWRYIYDVDPVIKGLLWIVIFFIVNLIIFFIDKYIFTYYTGAALIILFIIVRFSCRENFKNFEDAKKRIEREIKLDEEEKIKRDKEQNPKIHYLNIKIERQEKLNQLNKN